jgi:hypothetical protein
VYHWYQGDQNNGDKMGTNVARILKNNLINFTTECTTGTREIKTRGCKEGRGVTRIRKTEYKFTNFNQKKAEQAHLGYHDDGERG